MRWFENWFSTSIEKLIQQELDHSKRQLLLAESSMDSAKALVDYNKAVIARLEARYGTEKDNGTSSQNQAL